jgi:hypothetical protein
MLRGMEDVLSIDRVQGAYTTEDETFLIKQRAFGQQYAHIYRVRLTQLRQVIYEQARNKWGHQGESTSLIAILDDKHS